MDCILWLCLPAMSYLPCSTVVEPILHSALTLARVELDMYRVGPLLLVLNYNTAAFTVCSLHSFTRDQGGQMCERGNRCGLWVFQGVHQPLPPRHAAHRLPPLSERLISAHCYNRLCHTLLCVCERECALNICSNMSAVVYLRHLWVKVFFCAASVFLVQNNWGNVFVICSHNTNPFHFSHW